MAMPLVCNAANLLPCHEYPRMTVIYDEFTVLRAKQPVTAAIVVERAKCKSFVIRFSERFPLIQRICQPFEELPYRLGRLLPCSF